MRKIIIMSGVSGSGKSSYVRERIVPTLPEESSFLLVSADHYFIDFETGDYRFDASKLSDAHGACFKEFIHACQDNVDVIAVDNTNTTSEEIAPYILGAQAFEYEVEIITFHRGNMSEENYILACAKMNTHGVPEQAIRAQYNRLQKRTLLPWWKNTFIPVQF